MTEPEQTNRLPNPLRVSHQPVMVAGLTGSELLMALAIGFVVFIAASACTLVILGAVHFALLAGGILGVAASVGLRGFIVRLKRQRPEGYPLQVVLHARHRIEPIPGLVSVEGHWDPWRHVS